MNKNAPVTTLGSAATGDHLPVAAGTAQGAAALGCVQVSAWLGHGAGRVQVLHGVDLHLPAGRWLSIVGPNGAGKSTLLRCLAGLLPHQGTVSLLGRPLADWPAKDRAKALSWLGQGGAGAEQGADDLTAYDVVMLGRLPHQGWLSPPSAADHAAVEHAMAQTQSWDWACKPLGQLSGGERQRVLLARALAVQASVLLMDEPLANLDPPHQADWLALVRQLVAQGKTVVSVLHEITLALAADEVLVMDRGHARHCGPSHHPDTHAALEAVFEHRIGIHRLMDQWVMLPNLK
jgi:iron complex transport system ATP-binding protein